MMRNTTLLVLAAAAALTVAACGGSDSSDTTGLPGGGEAAANPPECESGRGDPAEIAAAKLYIEHNHTDEDTGVHGAFDDDGWAQLCVYDPSGRMVLLVDPRAQLGDLTMAGIFFESREPPNDEYSVSDLEADFPEGRYEVRGITYEGKAIAGEATFSHRIPAPATITSPSLAEDEEEAEAALAPATGLVVTWEPVAATLDGGPITVTGYEVIITKEVEDDPNGFSRPIFDVHVPAGITSLSVPDEFLEPGTLYELEVLVLEETGNQTITVGFFTTE
jgi:hypothetical protein